MCCHSGALWQIFLFVLYSPGSCSIVVGCTALNNHLAVVQNIPDLTAASGDNTDRQHGSWHIIGHEKFLSFKERDDGLSCPPVSERQWCLSSSGNTRHRHTTAVASPFCPVAVSTTPPVTMVVCALAAIVSSRMAASNHSFTCFIVDILDCYLCLFASRIFSNICAAHSSVRGSW